MAATIFLLFSGTLDHQFLNWDDNFYVTGNPASPLTLDSVRWILTHPHYHSYIPVTLLSHALDTDLWGNNPSGHHLSNLLLHTFNTVLVLVLAIRIGRIARGRRARSGTVASDGLSLLLGASLAALLFGVHPLRVESVAWVSDRKDLLCTSFALLSFLAYLRLTSRPEPHNSWGWYWLAFVLFLLAVLSKAIAVALPIVLILTDHFLLKRRLDGWAVLEKTPFLIVSVAISGIALAASSNTPKAYAVENLSTLEMILFPFYSLSFSLYKTVAPVALGPIYPRPALISMLLSLLLVAGVTTVGVMASRRGQHGILLAWLSYVALLIPNVVGLSSGIQHMADRYSYLSTIAIYLLLGFGIALALQRGSRIHRVALVMGCSIGILTLSLISIQQAMRWATSRSLWEYVVESNQLKPDYTAAYVNLASSYMEEGLLGESRRILERASAISPSNMAVWYNLGICASLQGETHKAIEYLSKSIEINPRHAESYFNLAAVYERLGDPRKFAEALTAAAKLGHRGAQEELAARGIPW